MAVTQPLMATWRRARDARRLANVLRSQIVRQYRHGERFTPEQELARDHGVSRNLARDALGLLQAEGVISRQQGMGTFVTSSKQFSGGRGPARGFSLREGAYHEVLALGSLTAPPPVAEILKSPAAASVVLLERRTIVATEPVALWTSYLPPGLADDLQHDDPRLAGDYYELLDDLLVEEGGVVGVELTVDATTARGDAAELLAVPEGAPLLRIERRVLSGIDRIVDYGFGLLRGDRVSISTWQAHGPAVPGALV